MLTSDVLDGYARRQRRRFEKRIVTSYSLAPGARVVEGYISMHAHDSTCTCHGSATPGEPTQLDNNDTFRHKSNELREAERALHPVTSAGRRQLDNPGIASSADSPNYCADSPTSLVLKVRGRWTDCIVRNACSLVVVFDRRAHTAYAGLHTIP